MKTRISMAKHGFVKLLIYYLFITKERVDGFGAFTKPFDVAAMAEDEDGCADCIDDCVFDAEEGGFADGEQPCQDVRIPGNRDRDDGDDPADQRAGDGGNDRGQGDVFALDGDGEIQEAKNHEIDPADQNHRTHETGNGLTALESEEARPAMSDRREENRAPVVEGGGFISVVPDEVGADGRGVGEDGPGDIEGDDGLEHVEDDDDDADLLAQNASRIGAAGVPGSVFADVLVEKDLSDDDAGGNRSEKVG